MFDITFTPTENELKAVNQYVYFKKQFKKERNKWGIALAVILFVVYSLMSLFANDMIGIVIGIPIIVIVEILVLLTPFGKWIGRKRQDNAIKRMVKSNSNVLCERTWKIDEASFIVVNQTNEVKCTLSAIKEVYILPESVVFFGEDGLYRFAPFRAFGNEKEKDRFIDFIKSNWIITQ